MVIRGMTQFQTMAQGMPNHIKRDLTKLTRSFIWGTDSPPPIAMAILNRPTGKGGKNVINIKACNKATYIMKLKRLATHLDGRPLVAIATLPRRTRELEALDPTITDLITQLLPHKATQISNCLPLEVRKTLEITKKYRLMIIAPTLTPTMKTEMPAWHHIGRPPTLTHIECRKSGKCLRKTHSCHQIGHLMTQVSYRETPNHTPSSRPCHCDNCTYLRN